MKKILPHIIFLTLFFASCSCSKNGQDVPVPGNQKIIIDSIYINNRYVANGRTISEISSDQNVQIRLTLFQEINPNSFAKESLKVSGGLDYTYTFPNYKTILCETTTQPKAATKYTVNVVDGVNSNGGNVINSYSASFITVTDTTDKFPRISDEELLTKVQQQTFKYFWDYAHPTSGLARERLNSGNTVTTGGSGFGFMAIIVGIERGFITHQQGLERFTKIVDFLNASSTEKFHGAFPHWINGQTGKALTFGTNDNGGDLVETAFLIQGLLAVYEYFKTDNSAEAVALCSNIQTIWQNVEWDWYRKNNENVLYWHWSADKGWAMNMKISGWNEGLIVYVLAAASPTHSITKDVYDQGWARNGNMRNGRSYYGTTLPLGGDGEKGGPMFFAHYSFLGLNPNKISDQYANYWAQNVAHAKINYSYCVANPKGYVGYSNVCWGLSASDIPGGYTASSPGNDRGTIAPTAALSSFPYTPAESLAALRYFYYKKGDKLWGDYGFKDAFCPSQSWYASSFLAIDQGPIVVMIENYRTQKIWKLFMQNTDVQSGLQKLGFTVTP